VLRASHFSQGHRAEGGAIDVWPGPEDQVFNIGVKESVMISADCNIREIISKLEDKDYYEMIYLLEKEATEAERRLLRPRRKLHEGQICGAEYLSNLKNLIFYLRYHAKPRSLRSEHIELLESVCAKHSNQTA